MKSTRDHQRKIHHAASAAVLLAGTTLAATNALAEQVSIQFSQTYPGGGTVTGLIVGEDLDGDGRLYSVAPGLADFLGIEAGGNEVTYASVRIEGVLGQTVTNVFDASVADIEDDSNFFWGFAYNLDGGPLGDEPDEGVSFSPLAPSTSYVAGSLFGPAFSPSVIPDPISTCGNAEGVACSAITTLEPVDPFPNFELLFDATSAEPIVAHQLLRYTFEQSGFDGGATIKGTISGRDLDGDGKIYSAPATSADFGFEFGDEVVFAQVDIFGVEPEPIRNVQDLVTNPIDSPAAFFFFASVNVAGSELGDEPGEGLSIAPFSPSTSVVIGDGASPLFFPFFLESPLGTCEDEELACTALVSLIPDPDSPTGAELVGLQLSSQPVSLTPAPFIVDSSFTGYWVNKIPSGEGLSIQSIDDGRMLVYWMSYDEAGNQRWLFGPGRREGLKIDVADVYVTDGGMFSALSPVEVGLQRVGDLDIEFSGCSDGVVRWMIDGIPGTMDIGRLTGLSNLECVR